MKTISKLLPASLTRKIVAGSCLLTAFFPKNAAAQATSATTLSSSSNPSYYGQGGVTFTAVVAGGGVTPSGTVQFQTNGINFGSAATLSGGSATSLALPTTLPAGSYTVTAVYSGDENYAPSSGGLPGGFKFQTLHSFTGGADGMFPFSGLVLSGNTLYGTAIYGGSSRDGSVFSIHTDGTGFTTLYSFTNGTDGMNPAGTLVLSGNTLYGTAYQGGSSHKGTVFSVTTTGTGFASLHSFSGGADGANPECSLILSGGTLYGTATAGGSSHDGAVFSLNSDGSGFTTLYSFTGGADGTSPLNGLILSGGTLYGTANAGGSSHKGTVFSLATNGTGFATLHSFTGGSDGASPDCSLFVTNDTLYGTASTGGTSNDGTVFSIATDGSGFTTLYSFTGGADGAAPHAGVVLSGNTLYGTAFGASRPDYGTVFSVATNGTGFATVYSFTNGADGLGPNAGLTLSGSSLYGAAYEGGSSNGGTVFVLQSGQQVVSRASPLITALPTASTLNYGQSLSNAVLAGGAASVPGTFAFTSPATVPGEGTNSVSVTFIPTDTVDYATAVTNVTVVVNQGNCMVTVSSSSNPSIYGQAGVTFQATVTGSGVTPNGTVQFQTNAVDFGAPVTLSYGSAVSPALPINLPAGNYTVTADYSGDGNYFPTNGALVPSAINLYVFTNGLDGSYPIDGLILAGSTLYGTASSFFNHPASNPNYGTIFSINTNGTGFTILYTFTNGIDGAFPSASLILSGTTLYGTASSGGSKGNGTLFSITTNGTGFTPLYQFTNAVTGGSPEGTLILSGTMFYGTTESGGSGGSGTVFSVTTNGTGFMVLHNFTTLSPPRNGTNNDGYAPEAGLILSGNTLYGTAYGGGSSGYGTVFSVTTNGTGFATLHQFTNGIDGSFPEAGLILSGNTLYGTANEGGSSGYGTVFSVATDGTAFSVLHGFTDHADGEYPEAPLVLSGNNLYGTAFYGSSNGSGTVFSVNTNGKAFNALYSFGELSDVTQGYNYGGRPQSGLLVDGASLYGTTGEVGGYGYGTLFSLQPVQQVIQAAPSFSGLAPNPSIPYGTTNVLLTGTIGVADPASYPPQGETISVTINGTTQTTSINDGTGDFAINCSLPFLPVTSNSIAISYYYAGDSGFSSASNAATALTIVPAAVTITSGLTANSKIYDGTTSTTLTSNNVVLAGVLGGSQVALNTNGYIANFVSAAPGSNVAVTVSGLTLSGASASNYFLIQPTNLTASITTPTLQIYNNLPNLTISWPTNLSNFVLSQTTNLDLPTIWTPVTNGIAVIGTNNTFTFTVGTNAEQFFALIAP